MHKFKTHTKKHNKTRNHQGFLPLILERKMIQQLNISYFIMASDSCKNSHLWRFKFPFCMRYGVRCVGFLRVMALKTKK